MKVDYYKHFFDMMKEHPDFDEHIVFGSICRVMALDSLSTKGDLISITKAYNDYKEQKNE
jgi:hypothetical protein